MTTIRGRSSSSLTDVGFGDLELEDVGLLAELDIEKNKAENGGAAHEAKPYEVHLSRFWHSPIWTSFTCSFFSISMTLVNKMILTTFDFKYHMLLLLYQNGMCVCLLQAAKRCGLADFEPLESSKLIAWIPLNFLFILMLLTGFYSLNLLSVPMATIFKNSTNVLITSGDYFLYGQPVNKGIVLSLLLMLMASFLAGLSDLEFNMYGYVWAIANCCVTAAYVLYMPRAIKDSKLNSFGRVYYNNLLSLPLVAIVDLTIYNDIPTFLRGDLLMPDASSNVAFFVTMLFSGCIGFFLSLTSFQCVQTTSPTTYAMVGAMNKIPLTILGVLLFKTQLNMQSVLFITLSLASGILYAYTKSKQGK